MVPMPMPMVTRGNKKMEMNIILLYVFAVRTLIFRVDANNQGQN
jgi:hypothetical protein